MTTATEYKGSRVMVKPKDALLMDSNWIHGPSGQNGDAAPKTVLEISTVLMIADDSDFSWIWDRCHWKGYLLSFSCRCGTSKMEVVLFWNLMRIMIFNVAILLSRLGSLMICTHDLYVLTKRRRNNLLSRIIRIWWPKRSRQTFL
jgi:hypothetical protein